VLLSATTPVATLDCITNERSPDARRRSKSREPTDSAGTRSNPQQGQRSWRALARRPSPRSSREPVASPDGDRPEPQRHREKEEERADVVAAKDERNAADVLRRLHERQRGGDQHRCLETGVTEERAGSGRQREQADAGQDPARELDLKRSAEQPAQPPPVRSLLEAEAVLDEGLLDRQVEQRLEEPGRRDDDRVQTEGPGRERVRRYDGAEEAEGY
jgi:hypothetical protein